MTSSDDPDELARKMLELPPDWWQSANAARTLLQWFKRHIIPLLVAGSVGHEFQYCIYTGILLRHDQNIVWLTAGHVVDELVRFLSSSAFKLSKMTWLDGYEVAKAEAVPLHRTDIPMKSWRDAGLDVGAVLPSLLDVGNILRNEKVQTIDSGIWKNLSQASPEGYYAIGFPRPWSHHSKKLVLNKKVLHSVNADPACLPLKGIPPPPELADLPGWSDSEAFYGKILPYPDYPAFKVEEIKGMSGGPILSVERDPDGRIRYRLVGVIQSWAPSQSIIRAEPVHRVAEAIDAWLEEKV